MGKSDALSPKERTMAQAPMTMTHDLLTQISLQSDTKGIEIFGERRHF